MVLTDVLIYNAKHYPAYKALSMRMGYRRITLTYKKVYDMARKTAFYLDQLGVKPGDRIVVCAPNSPYWVVLFWAVLLRGARIVPVTLQSSRSIITKILDHTQARVVFVHRFYKYTHTNNITLICLDMLPEIIEQYNPDDCTIHQAKPDDVFQIMFTSGTTGQPKGVMLSHGNVMSTMIGVKKIIAIKSGTQRFLSIIPLSHIFEQTVGFLLPYSYAGHICYTHSYTALSDLLKEHKPHIIIAVPEFLQLFKQRIIDVVSKRKQQKLFSWLISLSRLIGCQFISRIFFYSLHKRFGGKLRMIVSGGAPLDKDLERFWYDLGIPILQGYGLTETSPIVTCNTFGQHRFGSAGKVLDGVSIRLGDQDEVEVTGPNVFSGYYLNEEKTKEVFTQDGWFKTGDIGRIDSDGFLFLKGRKKYMILGPGGQNVFPEDIERELGNEPEVVDSCVLGLDQAHGQQCIHAVLLPSDHNSNLQDMSEIFDKVINRVNQRLASYQHINSYSIWTEPDFPRTATKKIRKQEVMQKVIDDEQVQKKDSIAPLCPLVKILSCVSGVEEEKIQPTTKVLTGLSIDSLMRVELLIRIEEHFSVFLDDSHITNHTTVAHLEDMIEHGLTRRPIKPRLKKWPRWWWVKVLRLFFLQPLVFLCTRIFVRLKVEGCDHLQSHDQLIFMPNHLSYLDFFVLCMALPFRFKKRLAFAAARDVLYGCYSQFRFLGELIFNAFPFPRHEHEDVQEGLNNMEQLLDAGQNVVVFPEGHISNDGALLPFKRGAGLIATQMDCSVVIVKLIGTNHILGFDQFIPRRRGTVRVIFSPVLRFKKSDSYDVVTKRLEEVMQNLPSK